MLRKDLSVAIIDIPNFKEIARVKSFFGEFGTPVVILAAQYMNSKDVLIGLHQQTDKTLGELYTVLENRGFGVKTYFSYREVSKAVNGLVWQVGPSIGEGRSLYPQCLAFNHREDMVLMGGSDSKDSRMGEAILAVFKIDSEKLTYIDDLVLESYDRNKSMSTTTLLRVMGTDVFFAGCFSSISVIEWTNIKLAILAKYSAVHSWLLTQITTSSEEFFSICKNDKFLVYERINITGF